MAYTTIDKPSDYFDTKLYTGNGGTQSITGLDFAPNFVWIKKKSAAGSHKLFDTIRGATEVLRTNLNDAEATQSTTLTSFTSDGFAVGSNGDVNGNTNTIVSWNWKAGTSFTNDASSTSVGSIDSTGSVNTDAGFSIISYTGTGSVATIAHGLGVTPSCFITKCRSNNGTSWGMYHQSVGNTAFMEFSTAAKQTNAAYFNNTSPTSSVFTIGTDTINNGDGLTFIAYCFNDVQGYSKFGGYTGNGNADGTFVYTGFKPAFVIVKLTSGSGEHWYIQDATRDTFNPSAKRIKAQTNDAELDNTAFNIDFLSNGMKMRNTNAGHNGSGSTYIYTVFAENPFVTSTGVPATAK